MGNLKRLIAVCAAVAAMAATSVTAFAATYDTPAEAAAGVTGKTLVDVISERDAGMTYGEIAAAEGKLAEFHTAMLDIHRDTLDTRVANGTLTRARADELWTVMQDRQALCDGTGAACGGIGCGIAEAAGTGAGTGYSAGVGRSYGHHGGGHGGCWRY